jgi:hypothetical protein
VLLKEDSGAMSGKQNDEKSSNDNEHPKTPARCSHIKADGKKCKAIAMLSTGKCTIHSGILPYESAKIKLSRSVVDVQKFIARTMWACRKGKISPMVANAIFNGSDKLLKCYDVIETQAKIEEMKTMLEEFKSGSAEYADAQYLGALESEYEDK